MEEIIKDLEHTIKYFENAQNDFQRGRVFQAKKILEALRKHDFVGRSEQLSPNNKTKIVGDFDNNHNDSFRNID